MSRTAAILGSGGLALALASFATPVLSIFLVWVALLAVAVAALLGSRVLTVATIAVCAASILFVNSLVGLLGWMTGADAAGASVMNRGLLIATAVFFLAALAALLLYATGHSPFGPPREHAADPR